MPCPGNKPRTRHVVHTWVPAKAPSSSSLFGCQRSPAAHAGRTSGRDAIADSAIAPLAHSESGLLIQIVSRKSQIVGRSDGSSARNEEGPPGFPGGPSRVGVTRVTSSAWGASREGATAGALVISPKLRGFRRDQHRRCTSIGPAPRRGGGALLGLTVMWVAELHGGFRSTAV